MNASTISFRGKSVALLLLTLLFSINANAQETTEPLPVYYNNVFVALGIAIVFLLVAIAALGELVKTAAKRKGEMEREKRRGSQTGKVLSVLILFGLFSTSVNAQEAVEEIVPYVEFNYWGLGPWLFYTMVCIIAFEIWIVWALYNTAMDLIGRTAKKKKDVKQPSFIDKLNASVSVEEEKDIILDHNYDGIRELDNDLPPWWKYGFYATIVFAFIYLFNYHLGTGKLQIAEYQEQMDKAAVEQEEYRKKAANLVDENNATVLTDVASLESGKEIFVNNCAACHGHNGEGNVGPNLTDEYWIHKGGIKDIFRSIKLGWPEKGMKSWQQDLGAKQIHEVASYIRSLRGTNPANAKEKQGELYTEGAVSDSLKLGDSLIVMVPDSLKVPGEKK